MFVNAALLDLEISKTVTGNGGQGMAFDFALTLSNPDYDLSEIMYTKGGSTGYLLSIGTEEAGEYRFKLAHGESILIGGLPYGTEYEVEEILSDGTYDTTVSAAAAGGDDEPEVTEGTRTGGRLERDISIEFVNEGRFSEFEFPKTGGTGLWPLYLGGMAMVLAAPWLYGRRRRYGRG